MDALYWVRRAIMSEDGQFGIMSEPVGKHLFRAPQTMAGSGEREVKKRNTTSFKGPERNVKILFLVRILFYSCSMLPAEGNTFLLMSLGWNSISFASMVILCIWISWPGYWSRVA